MARRFQPRCRPPGRTGLCATGLAALLAASTPASANALLEALDAIAAARRAAALAEPQPDRADPAQRQASATAAQTAAEAPAAATPESSQRAKTGAKAERAKRVDIANRPAVVASLPAISIIIDDIGYSREIGAQLLDLPRPVTLSILPHSPHGAALAQRAQRSGHEIMLHLPMESSIGADSGPGTLASGMSGEQFERTLLDNLRAIPGISGVNNHMGSLLTSRRDAMQQLMDGIAAHGELFFVDSRTAIGTVAEDTARRFGIPSTRRDVFLDNLQEVAAIDRQFDKLLERARRNGYALAIGHPYPETLAVLQRRLPQLRGIRLIRVDQQIAERPPSASVAPLAQRP